MDFKTSGEQLAELRQQLYLHVPSEAAGQHRTDLFAPIGRQRDDELVDSVGLDELIELRDRS